MKHHWTWIIPLALAATPALASPPVAASDLQIMLDRAGFSSGEIDGRPGGNTRRALTAFQQTAQLDATGKLDAQTDATLRQAAGQAPLWRQYTITDADVRGPFVPLPDDMMEKSKLPALGFSSPLEAIAEAFHMAPKFLLKLNPGARFAVGEVLKVPNVRRTGEPAEDGALSAALVEVSKNGNYVLAKDQAGRLIFYAPATSGSEHDPLPIGDWKVKGVSKNPTFAYNPDLFWDAEAADTKAKLAAGPNNPVGEVWIDLDKEHYGLHGTAEPSKVGHAESHGCVRLTNWDALRLAAMVSPGTPVKFVM